MLTVTLSTIVDQRIIDTLTGTPGVTDVHVVDASRLRLVADRASEVLPTVLTRLDELGVGVEDSGEVPVDWDETFIELVGEREPS